MLANGTPTRQPSTSTTHSRSSLGHGLNTGVPRMRVSTAPSTPTGSRHAQPPPEATWGANFWVTLVDPQSGASFFACPSTGQVSWDPPVGNFVLPPSTDGEWWELADDSRGGISYYYHTKTGETVWERPDAFVIPLGVLQTTAMGKRLSMSMPVSAAVAPTTAPAASVNGSALTATNLSNAYGPSPTGTDAMDALSSPHTHSPAKPAYRRTHSSHAHHASPSWTEQLPTIPGSPYATSAEGSTPDLGAPAPKKKGSPRKGKERAAHQDSPVGQDSGASVHQDSGAQDSAAPVSQHNHHSGASGQSSGSPSPSPVSGRKRSNTAQAPPPSVHRSRSQPSLALQSLGAAVEYITMPPSPERRKTREAGPQVPAVPPIQTQMRKSFGFSRPPPSPRRPVPQTPTAAGTRLEGKEIGRPVLDREATANMSPVKNRAAGKPIPVPLNPTSGMNGTNGTSVRQSMLPQALVSEIQQFIESDYARKYFSEHRTGFIFRRRVPLEQLMSWQKSPLSSPLLTVNRTLHKDVVKIFKVIQRLMGESGRDRPVGVKSPDQTSTTTSSSFHESTASSPSTNAMLEEERWLLSEGLTHGELRDEIYCQLMKQLSGNPNPKSVFKGWQLFCVLLITFPPSKDFEPYLRTFIRKHTGQAEGRVDVMAKYCLRRLTVISKKGPRGKPPSLSEIETASDAAFNPSTFGESLDAVFRLQERNYPQAQVPIILPFLADGILALGGTKAEGIFRVPGDGDLVSELKLRLDRGYYTLDGVDDPHVLASLLKLWLRELLDPLVPDEMYNECIGLAKDAAACCGLVERLPTINRRVVLFVVSFLQLFLEERVLAATKMTSQNLALVMAPNVLRCNSDSIAVAFTNAGFEQTFVHNLLLHLKCDQVDPDYQPQHGLGAIRPSDPRKSQSGKRR